MRTRSIILTNLLLMFLALGCTSEVVENEPYQGFPLTLDQGTFKVSTPKGWSMTKEQGLDTSTGRITNGQIIIGYDRGFLSFQGLDHIQETENTIYLEHLKVDGVRAVIHKEHRDEKIVLSLYVDGGEEYKTWLNVLNPGNEELIKAIFKTHRFTAASY